MGDAVCRICSNCSMKTRKPRVFVTLCCLFAIVIGSFSSLFFYYPAFVEPGSLEGKNINVDGGYDFDNEFGYTDDPHSQHEISDEKVPRNYNNGKHNREFEFNPDSDKVRHAHHHLMNMNIDDGQTLNENEEIGEMEKSQYSNLIQNRLIHFDLKGAPPKMSFLKEVLKLAKASGINGVLIEWEDTFPWKSSLVNFTLTTGGYTLKEVEDLLNMAQSMELEVIPLIQTFGHVEFILKQEEFSYLRETEHDPQSFCPSKPETLTLIKEIIDQILEVHKTSRYVHIGCDEVFNLRICPLCLSSSESRDTLFLNHVTNVAKYVKGKGKIPIIWDDMLRSIPMRLLVESSIGSIIEPMVWVYAEDIDRFVGFETWEKYSKIFPTIWTAAAFKGAFGETLQIPIISRHADNVMKWIDVVQRESPRWDKGVGGLVLTGWQRYDHFSILCELLPAAIPSLVYNSLLLSTPGTNSEIRNRIFVPYIKNVTEEREETTAEQLEASETSTHQEEKMEEGEKRVKRAESSIISRIPHPRSLMQKDKSLGIAKFAGPLSRLTTRDINGEISERNEKISRKFVEILRCPISSGRPSPNIATFLKEMDLELSFASKCNFPGIGFFRSLFRFKSLIQEIWELQFKIERKRGWSSEYNFRHNFSLPLRIDEVILNNVPRYKRNLALTAKSVGNSLKVVFRGDVILEWIEQNVWEAWRILDQLETSGERMKTFTTWPRRPLKSPSKMIDDLGLHPLNLDREEL